MRHTRAAPEQPTVQPDGRDVQTLYLQVLSIQVLVVGNFVLPVPFAALESFSRRGTAGTRSWTARAEGL